VGAADPGLGTPTWPPVAVPPIGYLTEQLDDSQGLALMWGVMTGRIEMSELPLRRGEDARITFADRYAVTEILDSTGTMDAFAAHALADQCDTWWCKQMHPDDAR
jgi:hypothetical protein